MHNIAVLLTLLCTIASALQIPDLQPFFDAVGSYVDNGTSPVQFDLLKRQSSGCPSGFNNCANLGAAGLCCASSAVCSADAAGHVACCPSGSVCTGTIGGYIYSGTVDGNGNLITGGTAATTGTSATNGLIPVSATTTTTSGATTTNNNGGFIIASNTIVAQPALAVRGAEMPLVIQLLTRALQILH